VTAAQAVTAMAHLLGVAAAIAALELAWVRRALADDGVFAWPVLRRELARAPRPLRALADLVGSGRGIVLVIALQLAAALAVPWLEHPAPAWIVVATTLAIAFRFRGSYNGGSDAMLLIVATCVALARSAPGTAVERAALAYAAAQLVLSYVVAGVAKLSDPAWRRGTALPVLVALPQYRVPARARAALAHPLLARLAGWSVLGFECGVPLALLQPRACPVVLTVGAVFHLGNALVLGLNRFLWTWLAAYPALLYWAQQRPAG